MHIGLNIKKIREQKGLLQKEVAASGGVHPSNYSKIEKGEREPSIEVLDNLARLFGMSIDEIVHLDRDLPQEVKIEDKTLSEKLKLISLLNEDDKMAVFRIIDCMITKTKFQDFFHQNVATTKNA